MGFDRKIIVLSLLVALAGKADASPKEEKKFVVLENGHISAFFNLDNGALEGLKDKHSGWEIVEREALGQSFELLLPMTGPEFTDEDCGYNVVRGVEQEAPKVICHKDSLVFIWRRLKTPNMKSFADVEFHGTVALTEYGLEYSGKIVNNSCHVVEYVSWPCLGEVSIPDKRQFFMQNTRNDSKELFPHFNNQHGYWGVEWPTSTVMLNEKSYLQINDDDRGVLVFNRRIPQYLTITSFELIPGLEQRYTNPYQDEIDGVPVRIQFKVSNCIYALPGETASLDEVSLVPYKGTWSDGVELFRKLYTPVREGNFPVRKCSWKDEPLTWRKARCSTGDGLMKIASESVAAGVDVLLLNGWYGNVSGMPVEGRGVSEAIGKCQEMGLKVVLETSLSHVDRHSEAYLSDYRGYVMSDPYRLPYSYGWLCLGAADVRAKIGMMCAGLPALSAADGYMNRENNHDSRTFACFDMSHGHRYGEPCINGIRELNAEMYSLLSKGGEKAAFGFGFLLEQNDILDGYMLDVQPDMYPRHRLLSPFVPMLSKVGIREARAGMNRAVLYRMNIVYDLNFYNDCLSDYVHVVEYGNRIKEMRHRFSDLLWNAEFRGRGGANVIGHEIEWSVFERTDGKRAVVLANNGRENVSETYVSLENDGELFYISPEDMEPKPFRGSVDVNPLSIVVVFEK